MKRMLLILLSAALLMTGCAKEKAAPELPEGSADNAGNKTVLYCGENRFPLSFTTDGTQKIENGIYWYYELNDFAENTWEEPFYTYDINSLELDGQYTYDKLNRHQCYATNGSWPLFLNPVHTDYSSSNQDKVDEKLIELAKQQLAANQMEDAAVVITDVWSCDLDGNGGQETLFKACNCSVAEEGKSYCFLGYSNGDLCQGLYAQFRESGKCSLEELKPMVCDLNGDGKWSVLLYKKGDYESFTHYDYTDGNFIQSYEILF